MKHLVESVEGVPLMDPTTGDHISGLRPSVVTHTPFLDGLIGENRVKVLVKDVGDNASDDDYAAAHREDPAKAKAGLKTKPAAKAPTEA